MRCSRYLYTLVITDKEKAEKLKQSLPPGQYHGWMEKSLYMELEHFRAFVCIFTANHTYMSTTNKEMFKLTLLLKGKPLLGPCFFRSSLFSYFKGLYHAINPWRVNYIHTYITFSTKEHIIYKISYFRLLFSYLEVRLLDLWGSACLTSVSPTEQTTFEHLQRWMWI